VTKRLRVRRASAAAGIERGAEQTRTVRSGESIVAIRRSTMPKQFENPNAAKLESETASDASSEIKAELVAEKAAEKSSKTVQKFDRENSQLFSK
jgi:hypothetical protein